MWNVWSRTWLEIKHILCQCSIAKTIFKTEKVHKIVKEIYQHSVFISKGLHRATHICSSTDNYFIYTKHSQKLLRGFDGNHPSLEENRYKGIHPEFSLLRETHICMGNQQPGGQAIRTRGCVYLFLKVWRFLYMLRSILQCQGVQIILLANSVKTLGIMCPSSKGSFLAYDYTMDYSNRGFDIYLANDPKILVHHFNYHTTQIKKIQGLSQPSKSSHGHSSII